MNHLEYQRDCTLNAAMGLLSLGLVLAGMLFMYDAQPASAEAPFASSTMESKLRPGQTGLLLR